MSYKDEGYTPSEVKGVWIAADLEWCRRMWDTYDTTTSFPVFAWPLQNGQTEEDLVEELADDGIMAFIGTHRI